MTTMTSTTYSHDDACDARRKLNALLPSGVRAHTGVYNMGRTLGVVISASGPAEKGGGKVSRLYEFGWMARTDDHPGQPAPPWSNAALLQILDEWKTGTWVEPAAPVPVVPAGGPVAKTIHDRPEFEAWLRKAKPGQVCLYHVGSVAHYRAEGTDRLLLLQRLADDAKPSKPRPPAEAIEMRQLQAKMDLLSAVSTAADADQVHLSQRRSVEGEGRWIYYATKRWRR